MIYKCRLDYTEMFSQNIKAGMKASFEVSRKIAAAKKKSLNIGEEVILSCYKNIRSNVQGGSELEKLKHVSLSNDTVRKRIVKMFDGIMCAGGLKYPKFYFQLFCDPV